MLADMRSINLGEKLHRIAEQWLPKAAATANDHDVRQLNLQGECVRHQHAESDEFFLVIDGQLTMRMNDGDVALGPSDAVRAGVRPQAGSQPYRQPYDHQPYDKTESALLYEYLDIRDIRDALGASDTEDSRTAPSVDI